MSSPSEIRARLKEFVCSELMRRPDYPLGDQEPVFSGGLIDSFSIAHLGVFIEKTFGVYIPDAELTVAEMDTIDDIVARILR
jgi:acyl carrier protein